jgi:hypothetical protein
VKLWHDDVRPAPEGWVWARTNSSAKSLLETRLVTECSLDHDLGFHDVLRPDDPKSLAKVVRPHGRTEETGLDLVNWMVATGCVPAKVTIHSWNRDGATAMAASLIASGHPCVLAPYVQRAPSPAHAASGVVARQKSASADF